MITALMLDSREPDWVQKMDFPGIPTTVTMLPEGDVMAATDTGEIILIERKTPDDFLGSLRDERLFPQLANMLERTRWCYLVISGEFARGQNGKVITERETGWAYSAVQGALLSIQEMGIFIVYCAGDADYRDCILRIGKRERKADLLLMPARFPRILSIPESIVASLPGIGIERLNAVMAAAGSAAWALSALTDNSTKIPGISNGIKSRIRAALGLKEGQFLDVTLDHEDNQTLIVSTGD